MTIDRPTRAGLYGTIRSKCLICLEFQGHASTMQDVYDWRWSVCTTCLSSAGDIAKATHLAIAAINQRELATDDDD